MTGLLDTNIAVYFLNGQLVQPLPRGVYGISVITEMELLAWPSITSAQEKQARDFISSLTLCELTKPIREQAILLRRAGHGKLPDAIVAATALEFGIELLSNDSQFASIPGLKCRSLALRA